MDRRVVLALSLLLLFVGATLFLVNQPGERCIRVVLLGYVPNEGGVTVPTTVCVIRAPPGVYVPADVALDPTFLDSLREAYSAILERHHVSAAFLVRPDPRYTVVGESGGLGLYAAMYALLSNTDVSSCAFTGVVRGGELYPATHVEEKARAFSGTVVGAVDCPEGVVCVRTLSELESILGRCG